MTTEQAGHGVPGRHRAWFVAKWDRAPFRSLPHRERYLYLAMMLGPFSTAIPAVSVCGPAGLAEAVGDVPDIQEHLDAMKRDGVVVQEGRLFVLPDVIAESALFSPNQVKAWRRVLCPADRHRDLLRHAAPHHVPDSGAAEVVGHLSGASCVAGAHCGVGINESGEPGRGHQRRASWMNSSQILNGSSPSAVQTEN